MTDAQPETTTEVYSLVQYKNVPTDPFELEGFEGPWIPAQIVTFRIWPDTGVDFEHNPFPDWDEAEVTWTGDSCPPFKEDFGDEDPDSIDADRVNAREMYADLRKVGYHPYRVPQPA